MAAPKVEPGWIKQMQIGVYGVIAVDRVYRIIAGRVSVFLIDMPKSEKGGWHPWNLIHEIDDAPRWNAEPVEPVGESGVAN